MDNRIIIFILLGYILFTSFKLMLLTKDVREVEEESKNNTIALGSLINRVNRGG